jgi:DNA-binding transcriptional ArsR family regulator
MERLDIRVTVLRSMDAASGRAAMDYAALSGLLGALAYPVRLELLDRLRHPLSLGEIKVGALRDLGAGGLDRAAAKQTVAKHLQRLVEVGLVRVEKQESGGRQVPLYNVVPPALYALVEELRDLSVFRVTDQGHDLTASLSAAPRPPMVKGPHFVLVHGIFEGKHYGLDHGESATIGRHPSCTVRLEYDPYISGVNTHIEPMEDGLCIRDDPQSKNGTWLNWIPLAKGTAEPLVSGDLVGVGRSRLLFLDR